MFARVVNQRFQSQEVYALGRRSCTPSFALEYGLEPWGCAMRSNRADGRAGVNSSNVSAVITTWLQVPLFNRIKRCCKTFASNSSCDLSSMIVSDPLLLLQFVMMLACR